MRGRPVTEVEWTGIRNAARRRDWAEVARRAEALDWPLVAKQARRAAFDVDALLAVAWALLLDKADAPDPFAEGQEGSGAS